MINIANPTDVRTELEALANRVQRTDNLAAVRLRNLSSAVGRGPQFELWAAVDLYKTIAPDEIIERYKNGGITVRLVEQGRIIRISLIFALIFITLFGISQAISAYHSLIIAEPNQINSPYFYLWQRGFNGRLPGFLTPVSLSLIDAVLLFIVFILTFLSMLVRSSIERRTKELHAALLHVLAGASLSLQALSQRKNQEANQLFSPSGNLDKVAEQLNVMAQQMAYNFDRMTNSTATRFENMVQEITAMMLNERTQLNELASHREKEIVYLDQFTSLIARSLHEFVRSSDSLQQISVEISKNYQHFALSTESLLQQQMILSNTMNQSMSLQRDTSTVLRQIVTEQRHFGDLLQEAIGSITQAARVIFDGSVHLEEATQRQISFLQSQEDDRSKQTELIDQLATTATTISEALEMIDKAATSMRDMSLVMQKALEIQASLPETFQNSIQSSLQSMEVLPDTLSEAIQSYASTASAIARVSKSLDASALSIHSVSEELKNAVSEVGKR